MIGGTLEVGGKGRADAASRRHNGWRDVEGVTDGEVVVVAKGVVAAVGVFVFVLSTLS